MKNSNEKALVSNPFNVNIFCMKKILLVICVILFSPSFMAGKYNLDSLSHKGTKSVVINSINFKKLVLDGSGTSFDGSWQMDGSSILLFDKYLTPVRAYNCDGRYVGVVIKDGNSPDNIPEPAIISAVNKNGDIAVMTQSAFFFLYDSNFHIKYQYQYPWFLLLETESSDVVESINKLLITPNPEAPEMYEYNFAVKDMKCVNDTLFIPAITEHFAYNGYNIDDDAEKFWKDSYIFISFKMSNIGETRRIFGHYPPVYQNSNIPIFSTYDFAVVGNKVYVSFAADPLIYVMNKSGRLLYNIGYGDDNIKCLYPETKTFEEYEVGFDAQREKYGYYDRLYADGSMIFRTCHLDNGKWKLQIYENENMIGDVLMDKPLEIIGKYNNCYYGYVETDVATKQYVFVKFSL